MEKLRQDIRYAFRMLLKAPTFTIVATAALALGIGANAAMFSLTDAVLLRSLPVKDPDRLAAISFYGAKSGPSYDRSFSYPMYQDLRDRNEVFSGVLARGGAQMNVSYNGENDRVRGELVSGNFFEVLGVQPWAGRLFTADDDRTPGAEPVVVLSYGFWQRRFGKDAGIVGKTILVNEHPLTVIGVTPPDFYGIDLSTSPDVRVPLMMTPIFNPLPANRLQSRRNQWLTLMARRKDGVTQEGAQASVEVLYHQIREAEAQALPVGTSIVDRGRFLDTKISLSSGSQGLQRLQREMRTPLLLLFGATCVILLILCANLANLILARAAVRDQETAVRLALGAGRVRLLRQWLTETVLLSLIGAVAGVLVASWVKAALISFMPPDYRTNLNVVIGWRFVGFILLLSLLVGVLIGLPPALRATRSSSRLTGRAESRAFSAGGGLFSLRSGLVLTQVALSLPLLIISTLFLGSLRNLRGVDTGFGKNNVLIATINPALNGYSTERARIFYRDLLVGLRSTPGVQSASLSSDSPISGSWDQNTVKVEGYQAPEGEEVLAQRTSISADYFKSLAIPLIVGRDFDDRDTIGSPRVTIINEKMAHDFFGDADPIGRKIGTGKDPDTVIIGIVKDARYMRLREPPLRHYYEPIMQEANLFDLTMHVKTGGDPAAVVDLLRAQVRALDPHLPLYAVKTLETQIDESLAQERIVTWLCGAFGLLAMLLAALGLYGVMAFSVAQRTREIGIRIALGAQARDVFQLIISRGMLLVSTGVAIGIGASLALTRLVTSLLFGVAPTQAMPFILVSVGLALVALLACYVPARRATKVDPLVALRYE